MTDNVKDVRPAEDLREVAKQIGEAMTFCVSHYVQVCDTVLHQWKVVIDKELSNNG